MDPFEQKIYDTILNNRLICPGTGVIAGVSGGADSVCLLRVLLAFRSRLEIGLFCVHVEHGLRGNEALEDADFVQTLCAQYEIPCFVEHISVREMSKEQGLSLEEAGRRGRYALFEQIRQQCHAQVIAVAHHARDQAETVLLNLSRGSGVRGLAGMQMRSGYVIRPLLEIDRGEIISYLERIGQGWREDGTNSMDVFARNRIRLGVLPQLEQVNEKSVKHIGETAKFMRQAEEYLQHQAETLEKTCVVYDDRGAAVIDRDVLGAQDAIMQEYVLRQVIRRLRCGLGLKDLANVHIQALCRMLGMPSGKHADLPGDLTAKTQDEKHLYIGPALQPSGALLLENPLTGEKETEIILRREEIRQGIRLKAGRIYTGDGPVGGYSIFIQSESPGGSIPEKKYTKWLSYDKIKGNLCLRSRRSGDYLIINASGGRKKLKDYLIDQKIPASCRDSVLVLAQGSHILWVVGYRISEEAKVQSNKQKEVIRICVAETDSLTGFVNR